MIQCQCVVNVPEVLNSPPMVDDFARIKKEAFTSKVINNRRNKRFRPCLINSWFPWKRRNVMN